MVSYRRTHPSLAPQGGQHGGVDCGYGAIHVGVVNRGDAVPIRAAYQVVLDQPDLSQVFHIAVGARIQRHVLGAHLHHAQPVAESQDLGREQCSEEKQSMHIKWHRFPWVLMWCRRSTSMIISHL